MERLKKMARISIMLLVVAACKNETKIAPVDTNGINEMPIDSVKQDVTKVEKPKTIQEIKDELMSKGYQTFDYVDPKTQDTILMQQYFMVFLKSGPIRSQNEEEAAKLQEEHLAHLARMYEEGFADLIGPFGDHGNIRGVVVYNVPNQAMADSLAKLDPMVKAGRLEVEVHPWWSGKGYSLR
ncbi:MAG: YciI family protein [Flavobacteriaceae bacterium]|nr:hypothetical protein [Mangrovimonas sp.]MCB0432059.1 hypothetical protein [Mangrovimonas sp.]MCB0438639.1 hypothetical protein [Mangrovimonas sp.]HPF96520.1 YciI family protein [Mangrovimonas sp.]